MTDAGAPVKSLFLSAVGMQVPLDEGPPASPNLAILSLVGDDKARGLSLYNNLQELQCQSQTYSEAVLLQEHCGEWANQITQAGNGFVFRTVWPGWTQIASQAAVLSARNYWKTIEVIPGLAGSIDVWRDKIDFGALKKSRASFIQRFPKIDSARHAIAHPEYYADPNKKMAPDDGQEFYMRSFYSSEQGFTGIFMGETVTCEISHDAASFIAKNAADVFAAFENVIVRP